MTLYVSILSKGDNPIEGSSINKQSASVINPLPTASILSSAEETPPGQRNVYFRLAEVDRDTLPALLRDIGAQGTLRYVVDYRENKRTIHDLS